MDPLTLNAKPETLNPKPEIPNPKLYLITNPRPKNSNITHPGLRAEGGVQARLRPGDNEALPKDLRVVWALACGFRALDSSSVGFRV